MQINSDLGEMHLKGLYCLLFCAFQVNKILKTYYIICQGIEPGRPPSRWAIDALIWLRIFLKQKKNKGHEWESKDGYTIADM